MTDYGMPYLMECETIENCAALAADLQLQFVEINISFPDCLLCDELVDRLRKLQIQHGIYFTMHMDEQADPFSVNDTVREAWLKVFHQAFDVCRQVGIPVINMHLPRGTWITLPQEKVYIYEKYPYEDKIRAFRTMCENECASSGIRVCVENTNGYLPFEKRAVELLLESPCFALTLDIGHCHATGNVDEPFYREHTSRLHHMHAHDTMGKHDHLPFGRGEIDIKERLAWARKEGARVLLEVKTQDALKETVKKLPKYI